MERQVPSGAAVCARTGEYRSAWQLRSTSGSTMNTLPQHRWRIRACAVLLACVTLCVRVNAQEVGVTTRPVMAQALANVPGKTLSAVVVEYAPGGTSSRHQHAGIVFAYVLAGAVRSENSATGPAKIYKAGDAFFEPSGSTHLVCDN